MTMPACGTNFNARRNTQCDLPSICRMCDPKIPTRSDGYIAPETHQRRKQFFRRYRIPARVNPEGEYT